MRSGVGPRQQRRAGEEQNSKGRRERRQQRVGAGEGRSEGGGEKREAVVETE
jgi:hypothetical protein